MLPIYDKFYALPEVIQHKTIFGHLKSYNDKLNFDIDFTSKSNRPCLIFFYAGNQIDDFVDDDLIDEIITVCNKNLKNILILDTIIEDFVNKPFVDCLSKLLERGLTTDRIKIVTSGNPPSLFKHLFLQGGFLKDNGYEFRNKAFGKLDVISYDGFSTSFVLHQISSNAPLDEIKPRDFDLHFCLLQKNSRYLRKIVHAFFMHHKLDKKSIYSWHNAGLDTEWGTFEELACNEFGLDLDFERYKEPIIFDNFWETDEWHVGSDPAKRCAFNCYVETTALRDNPSIFYGDPLPHKDNYFLTEKTYKNFWYGLPYIHISFNLEDYLKHTGYKTFKHFIEYDKVPITSNHHYLQNDFNLILKISKMSIDELQSILNSESVIAQLKHNRKMLLRLLPLRNFVAQLDKY
tara:strand:- start:204 stop:1415 length:1212 start_codon:yes stop_codon:yes gene_type:complete